MALARVILVTDPSSSPWDSDDIVEKEDVELIHCDGAFDALDELSRDGASALITASKLPDMTGFQLCAFIKTALGLMSLPVGLINQDQDEVFWSTAAMADEMIPLDEFRKKDDGLNGLVDKLIELSNNMGWQSENAKDYFDGSLSSVEVMPSFRTVSDELLTARLVAGVVRMLSVAAVGKTEFIESLFRLSEVLAPVDMIGVALNGSKPWCVVHVDDKVSPTKADLIEEKIVQDLAFSQDVNFELQREGKRRGTRAIANTNIFPLYSSQGLLGSLMIGTCRKSGFPSKVLKFYEGIGNDLATIYSLLISKEHIVALESTAAFSASADNLTGLYNLEFLIGFLQQQLLFSFRQRLPVGLAIVDVDGLNDINQGFGSDVGDFVLTSIANRILNITRSSDLVARYSGDEFAVVLPNTDGDGAKILAEKVRTTIEHHSFSPDGAVNGPKVTVSVGCAMFNMEDLNAETILRDAKFALQQAKDKGPNHVALYENTDSE